MATDLENKANIEEDPFSIFGTKPEEIVSYDEPERRDWSKIFLELDAEKGEQTCLIKLCTNVFNPKDPLPKRYTYKLPRPENPSSQWNFLSPSTIGQKCPVMDLWFKLKGQEKKGDAVAGQKAKNLSRKRYRCVAVQIINSLSDPTLNGQFRLLRFPEGMDIDNLITAKLNPSEEERKLGAEPENVFDPFYSPLMILRCTKGSVGRDFSKSSWVPEKQYHGNLVPDKVDDKGNIISYRPLTAKDRENQTEARKHLVWLMEQLKKDDVSLEKQWMYKDPTEETLEEVRKSLELIETGSYTPSASTETSANGSEKLNNEVAKPAADPQPAQQPQGSQVESKVQGANVSEATKQSDDELMKELGIAN